MADLNSSKVNLFEEAATGVTGSKPNRITKVRIMDRNFYFKGIVFISLPLETKNNFEIFERGTLFKRVTFLDLLTVAVECVFMAFPICFVILYNLI